jgi:threonine dehydratase
LLSARLRVPTRIRCWSLPGGGLISALEAGRPVDAEASGLAADSLAPGRVGEFMFPLAQRFVDHVLLVSDDAIRAVQAALWQIARLAAGPGGAAALAARSISIAEPSAPERSSTCGRQREGPARARRT